MSIFLGIFMCYILCAFNRLFNFWSYMRLMCHEDLTLVHVTCLSVFNRLSDAFVANASGHLCTSVHLHPYLKLQQRDPKILIRLPVCVFFVPPSLPSTNDG